MKTLEWERIICLCNTDYGDKYPFDIAHNRITDFSLEGKSRKEVKSDISKIIFINIRDIRKQTPRSKAGMATHIVGTYDFESQKVVSTLLPTDISKQESYVLHNEELLEEAKQLINEIQELTNRIKAAEEEKDKRPAELPKQSVQSINIQPQFPEFIHALAESYKLSETPVVWKDTEEDRDRIKRWLDIDVTDDFFNLGGLKKMTPLLDMFGPTINGTDEEKAKHEKLVALSYKLLLLEVRINYLKTFAGLCFVLLAIQNISSIQDTDISVLVNIEIGEIIEPNEHLIWEDYEGLQGKLCRDDEDKMDIGIISELFGLDEDGIIHIEDIPYNPSTYIPSIPILANSGLVQSDKMAEDYKQELEEFIASTGGKGYYEFDVTNLRPNECRWLCSGMLLRPVDGDVKVYYQICSRYSMGDLSGMLEMKIN